MCEMKSLKHFLHRETLSNCTVLHRISNFLLEMLVMKIFFYLAVMIGESQSTDDGLEVHMGVNYVGHFLLTRLLLNSLIKGAEDQVCM
jgi:hypothetical protein